MIAVGVGTVAATRQERGQTAAASRVAEANTSPVGAGVAPALAAHQKHLVQRGTAALPVAAAAAPESVPAPEVELAAPTVVRLRLVQDRVHRCRRFVLREDFKSHMALSYIW